MAIPYDGKTLVQFTTQDLNITFIHRDKFRNATDLQIYIKTSCLFL